MFIHSLISLIALPGIVAVIAPHLIAYLDPWNRDHWAPGMFIIAVSAY
jgi:hypothetical protein